MVGNGEIINESYQLDFALQKLVTDLSSINLPHPNQPLNWLFLFRLAPSSRCPSQSSIQTKRWADDPSGDCYESHVPLDSVRENIYTHAGMIMSEVLDGR